VGLICLLAFLPLVRGGQQGWAAFVVSVGIMGLLAWGWLRAFWTSSSGFVLGREDVAFVLALFWTWLSLRFPTSPPDALGLSRITITREVGTAPETLTSRPAEASA